MKFLKPLLGIILLLPFTNCQKKVDSQATPPTNSTGLVPNISYRGGGSPPSWDAAKYTGNPADSAGLIHNLALWDLEGLELEDPEDAYYATVSYLEKRWVGGFDSAAFVTSFPISFVEDLIADSSNNYSNVIDNSGFSSEAKTLLTHLIEDLKDTSSLSSNFVYNDIKWTIKSWEIDVMNSGTLSAPEIASLSHIASVGRFSAFYWYDKFETEWDGMTQQQQEAVGKKRKWWQWLIVGVCDVIGVVAGATVNAGVAVSAGATASGAAATIINWGSN